MARRLKPWHAACMAKKQAAKQGVSGRFRAGVSGNPAGRPRKDAADPAAVSRTQALQRANAQFSNAKNRDGWSNSTTGMGISGRDKAVDTSFDLDIVDADTAVDIWRGDAIAAKIVEDPPNEATRQGFELCIGDDDAPARFDPPDPEPPATVPGTPKPPKMDGRYRIDAVTAALARKHPSAFARRVSRAVARERRRDAGEAKPMQEAITKKLDKLEALKVIRECMCYERAGGGGAALIGVKDYATDLRTPLDLRRVRSLDFLTPLEGRELRPLYFYNDPFAPNFGKPAIYQLVPFAVGAALDPTKVARVTQIHESRLIVFPGFRVSRRVLATGTYGWGDSIFTRCIRALRAFNTGYANAEILLADFAQAIYKIKGLAALIAKNPNALTDAMMNVELGRSVARAIVVDAEEDFERKSTSLSGYPETLDRFGVFLAACAGMPLTRILGISPGGLNSTGDSDIRGYYDTVAQGQQQRVAPALLRLTEVALAAMGEDPESINHSVKFPSLWQPTDKEMAEARYTQAQADCLYITNEVVSPEEIGLSRFGGDQYSFETRIDFEARADQQAIVAPTVEAKPKTLPPMIGSPQQPGAVTPDPAPSKPADKTPGEQ